MRAVPTFRWICLALAMSGTAASMDVTKRTNDRFTDFLLVSPCAVDNGISGYFNPASLNFVHGADVYVAFLDPRNPVDHPEAWGIFSGLGKSGFGMIEERSGAIGAGIATIRRYRTGFAFGNRAWGVGFGYGWSTGVEVRERYWTAGCIVRPSPFVSTGLSGLLPGSETERRGLAELAVRPFGTDRLSVFTDWRLNGKDRVRNGAWSAGVTVQPILGLQCSARIFNSNAFAVGLYASLGAAGAAIQVKTRNGEPESRLLTLRLGSPERGVADRYTVKKSRYLALDLKGKVAYRKYPLFDGDTRTLVGILRTLNDAASDPRIAGVVLHGSGVRFANAMGEGFPVSELAWEIRERLGVLRKSGKRVIVFLEEAGTTEYHLASVADRIVVDPLGMLALPGFALGRLYLRGTLDKLGIGVEEFRYFKYKSAFETLIRKNMSDADREQFQRLVDGWYDLVRKDVCLTRGLSPAVFDSLVNRKAVFLAGEAVATGLADTVGTWEEKDKIIERLEGKPMPCVDPRALEANRYAPRTWGRAPAIAVVYAVGACDMDTGIRSRELERIIRGLAKNARVRALVLRADSPGGSALASDRVAEALRAVAKKKPVIVSQGDVAGSGGYWISMYGDTIVSGPGTLTGSIGVIGGYLWNNGFGDKLGISTDVVKAGRHSDLGFGIPLPLLGVALPTRALDDEERVRVEMLIRSLYDDFVRRVAAGRRLAVDSVYALAEGRVWSGVDAKAKGLVDVIGGLETAVVLAKQAAGIPAGKDIELIELPKTGLFNALSIRFGNGATVDEFAWIKTYLQLLAEHPGQPMPLMPPGWF